MRTPGKERVKATRIRAKVDKGTATVADKEWLEQYEARVSLAQGERESPEPSKEVEPEPAQVGPEPSAIKRNTVTKQVNGKPVVQRYLTVSGEVAAGAIAGMVMGVNDKFKELAGELLLDMPGDTEAEKLANYEFCARDLLPEDGIKVRGRTFLLLMTVANAGNAFHKTRIQKTPEPQPDMAQFKFLCQDCHSELPAPETWPCRCPGCNKEYKPNE